MPHPGRILPTDLCPADLPGTLTRNGASKQTADNPILPAVRLVEALTSCTISRY